MTNTSNDGNPNLGKVTKIPTLRKIVTFLLAPALFSPGSRARLSRGEREPSSGCFLAAWLAITC